MKNLILSTIFGLGFSMAGCGGMEPVGEEQVDVTEEAIGASGKCEVVGGVETGYCIISGQCTRPLNKAVCPGPVVGNTTTLCSHTVDAKTCGYPF